MKYNYYHINFICYGLLLFIANNSVLVAQDASTLKYIDSVLQITHTLDGDARDNAFHDLNGYILKKGATSAKTLFEYALKKDTTAYSKMALYEGYSKNTSARGNPDESLKIKFKGLKLSEQLDAQGYEIYFHSSIANSYLFKNLTEKALYHLNIAEVLIERYKLPRYMWNVYYNKGLLQGAMGDVAGNALYFEKMWEQFEAQDNNSQKRFALYTLVEFYSGQEYPERLEKYVRLLAQLYEEAFPDMPPGHMPVSAIFKQITDPKLIPTYIKVHRISDSLQSLNSYFQATTALATIYNNQQQPKLALPYLKTAEKRWDTINKPAQLMELYGLLSETYALDGNYREALTYKISENELRNTVTSENVQKNIAALQVQFETEKKERQIIQQNLEIEKKNKQRNYILFGLIFLGIMLLVTFLFFRKRLHYQNTIAKQEKTLQQQEITDLKQKNKLLALNSMIEGQEAERLRIAKDLHDSLGGLLSTVKAHFSTIQKEIEHLEKLNITGKTNDLIDEACIEVRRISHNMMPHALTIAGLSGALEDMAEHLREQGYEVILEVRKIPENLAATKEVMVYRLIQEIISNIRKHAEAKSILIQLFGHQNNLTLLIEDDGTGFNYEEALLKGGLGLKSINSRAEYLDGTINWDSHANSGTSITINISIK